jgi:hypothetical protein
VKEKWCRTPDLAGRSLPSSISVATNHLIDLTKGCISASLRAFRVDSLVVKVRQNPDFVEALAHRRAADTDLSRADIENQAL